MKVCIKPADPTTGISNRFFRFEKNFAYIVPDDFVPGDRFDVLEMNGKEFKKKNKLDEQKADALLSDNNEKEIIENLRKLDPTYDDIALLISSEAKKRKRRALLSYLRSLPQKAPEKVVVYKKGNIWFHELQTVKGVSQKDALNIMALYPSKEKLIEVLKEGKFQLEKDLEEKLREEYGLIERRNIPVPEQRERMRLDSLKEAAPSVEPEKISKATTSKMFKFGR